MEVYVIKTRVRELEMKTLTLRVWKPDPLKSDTECERQDIGWFVLFENSYESLFVGTEKPTNLDPGTEVEIHLKPMRKLE